MARISHVLSLVALACLAHAPAKAGEAEDIAALQQHWVKAVERGDRAFVDRLLHRDYLNITAQGAMRGKAAVLSAAPPPAGSTQRFSDVRVRLHGDAAVVTGVNEFRANPATPAMAFAFTDVYVKEDGRWQVLSSQETRRATP